MDSTIIAAIIGAFGALLAASIPLIVRQRSKAANMAKLDTTSPSEAEKTFRSDPRIQRLLSNPNWRSTADAAIVNLFRNVESPVKDWPATSTWQQVVAIFREQRRA